MPGNASLVSNRPLYCALQPSIANAAYAATRQQNCLQWGASTDTVAVASRCLPASPPSNR